MLESLEPRRMLSGGPVVTRFVATPRIADQGTVNGTIVFTVTYRDLDGIDPTSITNRNLKVSGPNGYARWARAESSFADANGTVRVVRYKISSPGPRWTATNNGVYSVVLYGVGISDLLGNFADFKKLGSFRVNATGGSGGS